MSARLFIRFGKTDGVSADYALKMNVRRAILATLEHEKTEGECEVSVSFTDNGYIRELNREYRGLDKSTDVLSFPMYEREEIEAWTGGPLILGDIVISLERAKEQAAELGHSFLREISFLAIHSTLHLLGYDHERGEADEEEQCEAQRQIFETLKFEEQL